MSVGPYGWNYGWRAVSDGPADLGSGRSTGQSSSVSPRPDERRIFVVDRRTLWIRDVRAHAFASDDQEQYAPLGKMEGR
jgi:hypothetical protein